MEIYITNFSKHCFIPRMLSSIRGDKDNPEPHKIYDGSTSFIAQSIS